MLANKAVRGLGVFGQFAHVSPRVVAGVGVPNGVPVSGGLGRSEMISLIDCIPKEGELINSVAGRKRIVPVSWIAILLG